MVISHKYKFIFVKTSKTAGTSLEVYLSDICGEEDVFTPILPEVPGHRARNCEGFYNHIPASEIRDLISRDCWEEYFKFCIERNPWEKTLSWYSMLNKTSGPISWSEFLKSRDFPHNYFKYMDLKTDVALVDEVLYYENLNSDLDRVFKKMGVPFVGELTVKAKANYRDKKRHYREVIGKKDAAVIGRAFHKEIEMHGYTF